MDQHTSRQLAVPTSDMAEARNLRAIDLLSPAQQARARDLAAGMRFDSDSVLNSWGNKQSKALQSHTPKVLTAIHTSQLGGVGTVLDDFLQELRGTKPSALQDYHHAWWKAIPPFMWLFNEYHKALMRYETVGRKLDVMLHEFEKEQLGINADISMLKEVIGNNRSYLDELLVYLAAGQLQIDMQEEVTKQLEDAFALNNSIENERKLTDHKKRLDLFKQHLFHKLVEATIARRFEPVLETTLSSKQSYLQRITDGTSSMKNIWATAIAQAFAVYNLKRTRLLIERFDQAYEDLLRTAFDQSVTENVEAVRVAGRSPVRIEALIEFDQKTRQMIQQVAQAQKQVEEERAANQKRIMELNQSFQAALAAA